MDGFVLDVSACMPWCCEDEATTASEELLQRAAQREALHVPSLWPWEMMNAVAVSVRRQRVKLERARQFFEQLSSFHFRIAPAPSIEVFAELSLLASRHQLTAYDTACLGLVPCHHRLDEYLHAYIDQADIQGDAKGFLFCSMASKAGTALTEIGCINRMCIR